jgi:hypothetical protein
MAKNRKQRDRGATEPGSTPTRDEGFLSRWSRRKRDAIAPEKLANVAARADPQRIAPTPAQDAPESVNEKTDADMPPIETLNENSDYSPFLSPKVSQKLRSVALRKLFHKTGFNIRDGLDDYDDDFTLFEPLGNIITSDMRHHMEREKEKERRRLAELGDDESAETPADQPSQDGEQAQLASHDDAIEDDESSEVEPDEDGEDTPRA